MAVPVRILLKIVLMVLLGQVEVLERLQLDSELPVVLLLFGGENLLENR